MDASTIEADKIPAKPKNRFSLGAHNHVLEYIANTNLFMLCCVAACFSLISYLAAFSCEIAWILEAHGDLPTTSYLLCSGYFILFIASTILIHGLATGMSWGLLSWSVIIAALGIPELCLVMMITTQFWGLQSIHGLTELVSYIIRLIINCLALLCVIPTALRWRREQEVLKQLQGLASRLQLQTPPPSAPKAPNNDNLSRQGTNKRRRRSSGQVNPAFIVHESQLPFPYAYGVYGSQNEFNASVFGLDPSQYYGEMPQPHFNPSRTRSLLDLRNVVHPPQIMNQNPAHPPRGIDETDGPVSNKPEQGSEAGDPIYCTIGSDKGSSKPMPLMRNCVSLENLGGVTIKHDPISPEQHHKNAILMQQHPNSQIYNPNIIMQYQRHHIPGGYFPHAMNQPQWTPAYSSRMTPQDYWHWSRYGQTPVGFMPARNLYAHPQNDSVRNNVSNTTSKQSLGSDDFRKYRDVAL